VDRPKRDKHRQEKYDADKLAKARLQERNYKLKLLEEITGLIKESAKNASNVDDSQIFLSDFLRHNATILNSVVKSEAQDTKRRRKAHRKQAHDLIIEGLQGTTSLEAMHSTTAAMEQQMKHETSRTKQLREELDTLRDHEELTDTLVDQLRIKVESIDLLEESQVQLITNQLNQQRKLGQKIHNLVHQIQRHNLELADITLNVRVEILDKIEGMMGSKKQNMLSCFATLLMIFIIIAGIYYVVTESGLY